MSRFKILIALTVYLLLAIGLVFYLTDTPLRFSVTPANAAIAIRDNVSNLEKNGSLLFTQACLDKKYSKSIYFTQSFRGDLEQEFKDSLSYLLQNFDQVDIYLLAHHNRYYTWLRSIDPLLLSKINLIYNTGCGNADQHDVYSDLGVKHYIAHRGKQSLSPIFYVYFLRRYTAGYGLDTATMEANQQSLKVLGFLGIENEIKEHEGNMY